ncbi:hypothetical protein H6F89_33480 [Cyanobacteria bacterium FACHB-63]|nr:hypothetical protein [Cyanobacteria bacterium FACHB-63]
MTRAAYLKAIQQAKDSVENKRLIDPDHFEQEAHKYWQSIVKGTSELGGRLSNAAMKGAAQVGKRLGAAARAAWKEFLHPQPSSETPAPALLEAEQEVVAIEEPIEPTAETPIEEPTSEAQAEPANEAVVEEPTPEAPVGEPTNTETSLLEQDTPDG